MSNKTTLIEQGIEKQLIKFDAEKKYITYIHQNKKRNYTNPEEQVQAESFLKLALTYCYPLYLCFHFFVILLKQK
jgi:hypothetical protein